MGAVRKVATYLGLGGAENYDESYDYEEEVEGEEEDWQSASERAAKRWRAMNEPSRIVMLTPMKYNDAPVIGQHFREGQTVIMDVSGMSTAEATRMVDFVAGLAYGCEGRIERIAEKVFLLAPAEVEISNG
ncbi:cell division protein SepF [Streptosporangium sp. NPDC048865]|uniref:cell division protein SepF n=1 Tax=Streptosporangium sp. NPDC048865 TaxID=3155766 RepID=UPI003423F028